MPEYIFADLVREASMGEGTGPLVLAGPVPGHRAFAGAVPVGAAFHYAIAGVTWPGEWETGIGQLDGAGRLQRDAVAASSAGGAPVDFGAGMKTAALTVGSGWFSASESAVAALADDVAGKQPVSTAHASVSSLAASDAVTVRRGSGWVNAPLAALVYRQASGQYSCQGDLGIGTDSPAARVEVTGTVPNIRMTAQNYNDAYGFEITAGGQIDAAFKARGSTGELNISSGRSAGWGGSIRFHTDMAERMRITAAGTVHPGSDNGQALGTSGQRWSVVYAGTGMIQTSDARDKQWRGGMCAAERRAARRILAELGFYQWTEAVAAKGADDARWHFGVRAQAVWGIMADEGLVAPIGADGVPATARYGFLCFDRWDDGGAVRSRFGVRSDQLALFLIAGLAPAARRTKAGPC